MSHVVETRVQMASEACTVWFTKHRGSEQERNTYYKLWSALAAEGDDSVLEDAAESSEARECHGRVIDITNLIMEDDPQVDSEQRIEGAAYEIELCDEEVDDLEVAAIAPKTYVEVSTRVVWDLDQGVLAKDYERWHFSSLLQQCSGMVQRLKDSEESYGPSVVHLQVRFSFVVACYRQRCDAARRCAQAMRISMALDAVAVQSAVEQPTFFPAQMLAMTGEQGRQLVYQELQLESTVPPGLQIAGHHRQYHEEKRHLEMMTVWRKDGGGDTSQSGSSAKSVETVKRLAGDRCMLMMTKSGTSGGRNAVVDFQMGKQTVAVVLHDLQAHFTRCSLDRLDVTSVVPGVRMNFSYAVMDSLSKARLGAPGTGLSVFQCMPLGVNEKRAAHHFFNIKKTPKPKDLTETEIKALVDASVDDEGVVKALWQFGRCVEHLINKELGRYLIRQGEILMAWRKSIPVSSREALASCKLVMRLIDFTGALLTQYNEAAVNAVFTPGFNPVSVLENLKAEFPYLAPKIVNHRDLPLVEMREFCWLKMELKKDECRLWNLTEEEWRLVVLQVLRTAAAVWRKWKSFAYVDDFYCLTQVLGAEPEKLNHTLEKAGALLLGKDGWSYSKVAEDGFFAWLHKMTGRL